jgi:hypothetical protein
MIVISHPWEFVPKGSSHLNYQTTTNTTKDSENTKDVAATANIAAGSGSSSSRINNLIGNLAATSNNNNNQPPTSNIPLSIQQHRTNKILFHQQSSLNTGRKIADDANSSTHDFSINYIQKSPLFNNNINNFETIVNKS